MVLLLPDIPTVIGWAARKTALPRPLILGWLYK